MSDRKQILELLKELGQNPAARKTYSQNPQAVLMDYAIEGSDRAQILSHNWKDLVKVHNDSNMPFINSTNSLGLRMKL